MSTVAKSRSRSSLPENDGTAAPPDTQPPAAPSEEKKKSAAPQGYALWVALCFLINYMIGVGILEIPYVFYRAGLVYATFMVIFTGLLMAAATVWVVEAMVRGGKACSLLLSPSPHFAHSVGGSLCFSWVCHSGDES
jgi:hypothetical protein